MALLDSTIEEWKAEAQKSADANPAVLAPAVLALIAEIDTLKTLEFLAYESMRGTEWELAQLRASKS